MANRHLLSAKEYFVMDERLSILQGFLLQLRLMEI